MSPWLSPLCLILGKNIQSGIMVFLEVQKIHLQGNMRGSKCDKYCTFFALRKSAFPFRPCSFFSEIFLPQLPVTFSTDLNSLSAKFIKWSNTLKQIVLTSTPSDVFN